MSTRIDEIISRLPQMPAKARAEWRDKAQRVLSRRPDDPDALRLLSALDAADERPEKKRLISTGAIAWEPHDSSSPDCRGFADGVLVARIFKHATHTAVRKAVYSVEVAGTVLRGRFPHISKAREAGEAAFREMRRSKN